MVAIVVVAAAVAVVDESLSLSVLSPTRISTERWVLGPSEASPGGLWAQAEERWW